MLARRALSALLALAALAAPPWLAARVCDAPAGRGRALVYVSGPEPETLDPALATGLPEVRLLTALFEGLVALDPRTLEPRPAAAEAWDADPDGVTFRLREGLRFGDGSPLAAADFAYAFDRVREPRTGSPWAEAVSGLEWRALDPRTLRIAGPRARGDLLARLTLPCFYPVARGAVEAHGERWTRPGSLVSNGPFRLAAWEINRRIGLERNPHFRAPVGIEAVVALTVEGPSVGFNLYATGAADIVHSVPAALLPDLAGRADLHTGPLLATYFLRMNVGRPPFDDPHARRAFALAIDREAIVRHVTRSGEPVARSLCPPGMGGYEPGGGPAGWFDPAEARRELEASRYGGARGLPEVEYLYEGAANGRIGEVLQDQWLRHLGVRVRLRPMERKVAFATVRAREYQIAWSSWVADYPDAANFLEVFESGSGNNRTGHADPEYDALLERARRAKGDDRLGRLAEAEALLLEAAPIAPIYHYARGVLVSPRVRGFVSNPLNRIDWTALELAPGPAGGARSP